ncbi:MAG: ABC transporter permease [Lachnospiraceae bacterium]|nr:ABC transporter permease [Lachnospiraceae bacterium]
MTNLLLVRDALKNVYGKYEMFITPVLKFILALITYLLINKHLGYMDTLDNPVIPVMAAIINSFLPVNTIVLFSFLMICLHVYRLSLIAAAATLVIMAVLFLVFLRFSPDSALAAVLTPLAFLFNVPFAVPICAGLVSSPLSAVSVACGIIVYYFLQYITSNSTSIQNPGDTQPADQLKGILNAVVNNKTMVLYVIVFAITILVVYIIRRLSINYSWMIAIVAGSLVEIIAIIVGDGTLGANVSFASVLLGIIIGAVVGLILHFFVFSVDYSRTEYVQFEDEEYYYYVKAVPKLTVSATDLQVKKINRVNRPNRSRDRLDARD